MSIFIFTINFIHSIAASIWLGGCFLMITLSISHKFKLIENYQSIFQTISYSLRELVNGSMILIFLTGIIMTIQKLSLVQTDASYAIILVLKILLFIFKKILLKFQLMENLIIVQDWELNINFHQVLNLDLA